MASRLGRGGPQTAAGTAALHWNSQSEGFPGLNTFLMAIDWQTFWLTLQLAITVSAILLMLGLPIAWWIAFSGWRWKFLVEAVVALPIVLPPTVLGFYLLVALGPRSPLGRWSIALTGH